jgi:hypothetical protein
MYKKFGFKRSIISFVSIAVILLIVSCASKKPFWGDSKSGLILEYRMPEGQALKYQNTMNVVQTMDMMGQEVQNVSNMDLTFSTKSKGIKNNLHMLGVTIDGLNLSVESPQGNFDPDMSTMIGKSFDMDLSFLGKESNLEGAKKIKYTLGPEGDRDLHSSFQTIFPNLAGKPLKIGDTFTTRDTLNVDEGGISLQMVFENSNTLAGFETVSGYECVKVTAKVKGTMKGSGNQGGADLELEGDIEADEMWFFAYKKGLLIKQNSNSLVESTILVTGPQEMTFPMTMEMKFELNLLK